jgi:hypothetical protein
MIKKIDSKLKFIVCPKTVAFPSCQADHWVLLIDYVYWDEHITELEEWCDATLANGKESITGMSLEFSTNQEVTFFVLRWS